MIKLSKKILNKFPWRFQAYFGYRPKGQKTIRNYFKKESTPNFNDEFYKKELFEGDISLNEAITLNSRKHLNYTEISKKPFDECLIFGLKKARYIQHVWVPTFIASNNYLLIDASKDPKKGRALHPIFSLNDVGDSIKIRGKSLVLCNDGCHDGYFHWVARMLTKLWAIEKNGFSINNFDWVIVNGPEMQFKSSTLKDFGIPQDKIIYTEAEQLYKFDFMIGVNNIRYHKEGINFMREKYLTKKNIEVDRKVYLSRQKAKHRKIIEEDKLIRYLEKKGYEIIDFADYSVVEQAEIMASTKELITIHGAGLANLIFASPKMKLLEILEDTFVNVNYWFYSNLMDVNYYYYLGKAVKSEYSKKINRSGFDDIELEEEFYERLNEFLS
jgi:hypothetical protein